MATEASRAAPAAPRRSAARHAVWAGIAALLVMVGYPIVVHELIASARWPWLTVLAGLLPALGLAALVAFNAGRRWLAVLLFIAGAALGWHWRAALQGSSAWIHLVQHVGMQFFLCWLFGRTLAPGRTALVTRLALRVHGTLAPPLLRYTRNATRAWALFFALDGALSALLFGFAPLAVWSLFANVLTLPLVALMFVGEYAVRRIAHPHFAHVSIATGVRAFWNDPADAARSQPFPAATSADARSGPPCPR